MDAAAGVEPPKDSSTTLPRLVSSLVRTESVCCMIPTLMLKHQDSSRSSHGSVEEYAALNLARPLALTRGELPAAPLTLLGNLIDSFMSLVDSRKRSSLTALIRQSQTQKDSTLTRVLVGLLACSNDPITPSTVVTSFRVLQASERNASGDLVMPLVMETVVDLNIFGSLVTINVVAPGTIQASFASDCMITNVEVVLDTVVFLQSMMKQARFAVRKAVALSSNMASTLLGFSSSSSKQQSDDRSTTSGSSVAPPVKVRSFQKLAQEIGRVNSKADMTASSLMPPPPSRPSKRSIADMSSSSSFAMDTPMHNATWGEQSSAGLSLLTAAAGMNQSSGQEQQQLAAKKLKLSLFSSTHATPRKVTSCPRLDATS